MAESLQGDDHSTLISAAFTISDHFRVCAAMNTANSCGDPSFGFAEILSRFTCIPGDLTISLIADEGDGPSGVGLGPDRVDGANCGADNDNGRNESLFREHDPVSTTYHAHRFNDVRRGLYVFDFTAI